MQKSEGLLLELKAIGVSIRLCDEQRAMKAIRRYFNEVHKSAVESTLIAKNKPQYITPIYQD